MPISQPEEQLQRIQKEQLSYLLGKGHARFGKVAPRHPYKDDEGGTGGGAGLKLKEHPWLGQTPIGAASDLTLDAVENSVSQDEAEERANECCNELKQQPVIQNALGKGAHFTPPSPAPI